MYSMYDTLSIQTQFANSYIGLGLANFINLKSLYLKLREKGINQNDILEIAKHTRSLEFFEQITLDFTDDNEVYQDANDEGRQNLSTYFEGFSFKTLIVIFNVQKENNINLWLNFLKTQYMSSEQIQFTYNNKEIKKITFKKNNK